jgi:serine phosphatase RsbU (regulator of sigma subunit)/anti-sigma regulatory factor (Ser/Thr protein kinase)
VNAQVVRRIRLPAEHSSPGAARAAVRSALDEVGLTDVLDEALLLTTELSTNVVLHAKTDLDVEIVAEAGSVTVTVMDFRAGPITHNLWLARNAGGMGSELEERGRGLLLVDQLATCWGTLHHPGGKGVWFRLDRPTTKGAAPALSTPSFASLADLARSSATAPPVPAPAEPAGPPRRRSSEDAPSAEALADLAGGVHQRDQASLAEIGEELLGRLCPMIGAAGGALLVDEGDGRGPRTLAAYGAGVPTLDGVRVPLRLSRPWRGELVLTGAGGHLAGPYADALAELTAERLALVVENRRLRRSDSEWRTWLTFLAEVSELLAQSLDVDLTLALIPRLVVPRLGQWCAVHTADESGELKLAAAAHADETALPELLGALDAALPQLAEALQVDAAVPVAAPVEGYAVALTARGQHLGTLTVGRGSDHWQGAEELAVVEDVARRSALAIDNARIHAERRSIAEALQRSLLPPRLPEVAGIDFGAEYVPTGEGVDVGGDFYDVVSLPDGRWLVVVGDVSGKGVRAAAVTGLVRDVTRVLVRDGRALPEVLDRLNETLVERGGGRFCTLALAQVTPRNGGLLDVNLYLAGHDRPVLLRADGETSLTGTCGTAVGLLSKVSAPVMKLTLGHGDSLIFYTDGVTERRRGVELFGAERLRTEAASLAGFRADVVAARLRAATLAFSPDDPRDDIAIFALRNDTGT